jgi:hypothetical protein
MGLQASTDAGGGISLTALGKAEGAPLKRVNEAADLARRFPTKIAVGYVVPLCLAEILLWTRGLVAREEIESALQTATETLAEMGARGFEPDVFIRRAMLARLSSDEDGYRCELSEAYRLLTEMGATERAARLETDVGQASDRLRRVFEN